jgi:adenylate kinase family enzyme
MPAYLISGISGSGKTTVGLELKSRGYPVVETDSDDQLCAFYNRATGQKASIMLAHSADWYKEHVWNWDEVRLKELLDRFGGQPAFFCGGANNDRKFYSWFAKCFGLVADSDSLRKRLRERDPKRFAEGLPELERLVEMNKGTRGYYEKWGMVVINASQKPAKVVDEILSHIRQI